MPLLPPQMGIAYSTVKSQLRFGLVITGLGKYKMGLHWSGLTLSLPRQWTLTIPTTCSCSLMAMPNCMLVSVAAITLKFGQLTMPLIAMLSFLTG